MSRAYPAVTECYSVIRWNISVGSWYGGKYTATYAILSLSILSLLHPLSSFTGWWPHVASPKGQGVARVEAKGQGVPHRVPYMWGSFVLCSRHQVDALHHALK